MCKYDSRNGANDTFMCDTQTRVTTIQSKWVQ